MQTQEHATSPLFREVEARIIQEEQAMTKEEKTARWKHFEALERQHGVFGWRG